MSFEPDVEQEPRRGAGRPKGSRNRRTEELWQWCEDNKQIDPAHYLSGLINDTTVPQDLRAMAANYLLPYKYSKCGTSVPPRYIDDPVVLPNPDPRTVEQTTENINFITARKAQGLLDLDFAESIIADQCRIANNIISDAELQLKRLNSNASDQPMTIRIEGGLPALPGTNIIGLGGEPAPQMNGHAHGPVIEHQKTDSIPDDPELSDSGP